MKLTTERKIIQIFHQMDVLAYDIYTIFHEKTHDERYNGFWLKMAKEESEHILFWERAVELNVIPRFEYLFDNPNETLIELENAYTRARNLMQQIENSNDPSAAWMLAYRLEFYMLHSALEKLFHVLGPIVDAPNPGDTYESHINDFIAELSTHHDVSPEIELLGEALQRLWKENKKLALEATHDELSGLLNRRGFYAIAIPFAHLSQRTKSLIGLLMIAIAHFKSINDRFGHDVGDRVLRHTAKRISESLRKSDIVGRYGGEEFIIMLPETKEGVSMTIGENIRKRIAVDSIEGIPVKISVGCAETVVKKDAENELHELINHADQALYQAKNNGRNQVISYNPAEQAISTSGSKNAM